MEACRCEWLAGIQTAATRAFTSEYWSVVTMIGDGCLMAGLASMIVAVSCPGVLAMVQLGFVDI